MSARLRIDAVQLRTSEGPVRYEFRGPLTVLSGPVGTGKSTLFELIKHAIGGQALFTPVVGRYVDSVEVDLTVGRERLRLTRPTKGDGVDSVSVVDLVSSEDMGLYSAVVTGPADQSVRSISDLLLSSLEIPTDLRAIAASRKSTKTPPRISFNDIWSYVYVDQPEIDRSIVSHTESYREPKRKTVFEYLFRITDAEMIRLRASLQEADIALAKAEINEGYILQFLREVGTEGNDAALAEQRDVQRELEDHKSTLERLREEADPGDSRTDVMRDLLAGVQDRVDAARHTLAELQRSQDDRLNLAASIRQDVARLKRARDAVGRLAPIEFNTCPRCTQSLSGRETPEGACRLCLQDDTVEPSLGGAESYELKQLDSQQSEVQELISAGERQIAAVQGQLDESSRHAAELAYEVNVRTYELVSPRLQAFVDASSAVGKCEEKLRSIEETLRIWDRANDITNETLRLRREQHQLELGILEHENELNPRKEILETLSEAFQEVVDRLGVPGVQEAAIDPKSYLPLGDGKRFDRISTGGIRTALVVAYWTTLLATGLRYRETFMPSLLLLDSPRKSIGAGEALAANLYQQLDTLAEIYRRDMQIIVADNSLPAEYSRRWQEIYFDYDNPVVRTIPHPGPAGVVTVDQLAKRSRSAEVE